MKKNLIRTCVGYLLSYMGDTFIFIGLLSYFVYIDADAFYIASLSFCMSIGKFIAIPIATYVDFNNKKKIMVVSAIMRLILNVGLLSIVLGADLKLIVVLYFILVIVDSAAEKSFLPYVKSSSIDGEDLNLIISRIYTATNFMNVIAFAVSGLLMLTFGIEGILILNTVLFTISLGLLMVCHDYEGKEKKASLRSIKLTSHIEGVKFILHTKQLLLICIFATVLVAFLNTSLNLVLPLLSGELGLGKAFIGISYTILSVGMILGSGIVSFKKFNAVLTKYKVIFIAALVLVVLAGLLGVVTNQIMIVALVVIIGMTAGIGNTAISVNIVKIVPQEVLARVGTAIGLIFEAAAPIAIPVFTILIKQFGISPVMLYGSIVTLILAIIIIIINIKTIKEADSQLA